MLNREFKKGDLIVRIGGYFPCTVTMLCSDFYLVDYGTYTGTVDFSSEQSFVLVERGGEHA